MNKPDVKKLVLLNLPYIFAFYFADKIAAVFRLAPGTEFIDKLTNGFAVFGTAFANPLPSFQPVDLLIGLIAGALLKLAVYVKGKNRKKLRQGEEYGSARWGKPEDIKPYMDPEFSNNVILTQTEFLTMNSRPKQPKYARNKNILVIGGSGSGKTRFFVKPNLMQMHSSYVVTDPKGTVLVECGKMLEKGGYVIKSLNTINFRKSMHYNPFSYIRSEKDILKLVNTIIVNTKGDGDKSGEDFWVKAEKLYYTALIGYIWYEAPDHEKNFTTLLEMINASEAREDDETFKNPVDVMFDELEARDPDHFAVKQYRKYKLAAGAAGVIHGNTSIDIDSTIAQMRTGMENMGVGELLGLSIETLLISLCLKIMAILITVILYGRMIEIYCTVSIAPIPIATMSNREWGSIGTNYLKGLFALAFQGFLIMVCVGIYAVLINGMIIADNIHSALFSVAAYTVILCFSLFKTGSLAKSIFHAH